MNSQSFCNAVLNACNAKNPYTIKKYAILKAACLLREHYLNLHKQYLDEKIRSYGWRKYNMVDAEQMCPWDYKRYIESMDKYVDFRDAMNNLINREYNALFDNWKKYTSKERHKIKENIGKKYALMDKIIESHFDSEHGIFKFNDISFG